jgi:hypothetical protein
MKAKKTLKLSLETIRRLDLDAAQGGLHNLPRTRSLGASCGIGCIPETRSGGFGCKPGPIHSRYLSCGFGCI